jgi:uncharacterized protein YukE
MTDVAVGEYVDAAGHAVALSQAANMIEVVRDQLQSAISVLEQPPPPTMWWGAARREYETAARELANTMRGLRDALAARISGDYGGFGW